MKTAKEIFFFELAAMQDLEREAISILGLLVRSRVRDDTLKQILGDMVSMSDRHSARIDTCLRHLGVTPLHTRSGPIHGVREDFQNLLRIPHDDAVRDLFALNSAQRITNLAIAGYEHLTDWAITIGSVACTRCLIKNLAERTRIAQQLRERNQTLSEELLTSHT
ncbi:ferritin-like domain-containing protein [Micromonospora zamorensis]|uniref:Uncharacterized protein n=3 Tax=Micromonospora TaxID=1873 RepID=A0A3N9WUE1_9ACTN|nr:MULTISPECIES: DUF892 family protein [Micromonospora]RQW99262.1 hypothetical protein DLJ59_25055 [Micromonospora inaquosa]RQX04488.1 hypothetical protein DLJ58_27520 [Micromonospora arida]WSK48395.1 ferritin-like domain-containing protein [Micromonospora zamorensis]